MAARGGAAPAPVVCTSALIAAVASAATIRHGAFVNMAARTAGAVNAATSAYMAPLLVWGRGGAQINVFNT